MTVQDNFSDKSRLHRTRGVVIIFYDHEQVHIGKHAKNYGSPLTRISRITDSENLWKPMCEPEGT